MKKYAIVLVHLDKDKVSIGGQQFGSVGDYIEAPEFSRDKDIRYGIYGTLWGKTPNFRYTKIDVGYWAVVKTEYSDDLITVDNYYNTVKIRCGSILHIGSIKTAFNFIVKTYKDKNQLWYTGDVEIKEKDIAGSPEWLEKYYPERAMLV